MKIIPGHTKRYGQYTTSTLHLAIIGSGALLTVALQVESIIMYRALFIYVIPIFTYLIGLTYINFLYLIAKVEAYSCAIENKINIYAKANNIKGLTGWNTYIAREKLGADLFIYAYLLIFFGAYPWISIHFGHTYLIFGGEIDSLSSLSEWPKWVRYIIPFTLYTVYILIGIIISIRIIIVKKGILVL